MSSTKKEPRKRAFHTALCALLVAALSLVTACASYVTYYPYCFNRDSAAAVKRVAVAPWNLVTPMPDYVKGREGPVNDALVSYLKAHAIQAEQSDTAGTTWERQKVKLGGIYNSQNGKIDFAKAGAAMKATVSDVCDREGVDAVIFPQMIPRKATLDDRVIYWDGVVQQIEVGKGLVDRNMKWNGNIMALSLHIIVVDKNNRVVLRNLAGIDQFLEATREGTTPRWERRKDLLTEKKRIDHAVAVALHPLIPFPEYPEKPVFSTE